jgi:16S rRNA processing protein RimM
MKPETASPVLVARIIKPHGIHGEVVLESWTDVEGRLENTESFLLMDHGKILREIRVDSRRFIMGRPVFKFAGVTSRTDAESLRNLELAIPEDQIGELPEGQFFIFQLRGMSVEGKDGKLVGVVKDIVETPAGDLLELEGGELIPFMDEICTEVDVENRRIVIDPPEGLLSTEQRATSNEQ